MQNFKNVLAKIYFEKWDHACDYLVKDKKRCNSRNTDKTKKNIRTVHTVPIAFE